MPSAESAAPPTISYSRQYRRCNKADCPSCTLGGPGHGPYWYAYWREGGRRRSRYVGKHLPPEAATQIAEQQPEATDQEALDAPLRVRTLGGFAVWRGSTPLPASDWTHRHAARLFTCLLSAPRQRLHREQLAELLRPDAEPAASAAYLRATVHRLRRVLGHAGYLRQEGDLLLLAPAVEGTAPADWLDALAFEQAATAALAEGEAAACRAALALYGGEYLPAARYDEWAVTRREALQQQYLALLLHLAALREGDGVLGEAARCLRAVLACDPCHEPAARALMRVQVAAGRPGEAVRAYQQLAAALRRDLDLAPDLESEAQYQAVLVGHAAATRHCNLPTPLTSFVGREQEVARLARLLTATGASGPACRLLTVTGAGGCGKTRLAVELGHELRDSYREGLWLVELAALAEREADAEAIARQTIAVLGLRPEPEQGALATLLGYLRPRRTLLLLDNCEHQLAGSAAFAALVLEQCADLRILATSREGLAVLGETVWRLPSLAAPAWPWRGELSARAVGRYAAARLLVERARLVRPDYALTPDNCRAVAEICAQLDGIPLAIELAAARLGQLSAGDLAARLHDRFRLLTAGNRAALPRHQTLRAVVDWSYGLLDGEEQALLRALAVFAGGFTLDAVEAVCASTPLDGAGAPDLLARLVGKSLVEQEETEEAGGRYRLLETLRQYAGHRLREQGEEARARDRHLRWCLALAERAAPALAGPDQRFWLGRLEIEHDNLRAALGWSVRDGGDAEAGMLLAGALLRFWGARGHWHEGRQWLTAALSRPGGAPAARLRALRALGHLAINQGDPGVTRAVHEECLALGRALGDNGEIANALNGLANVARFQGDLARAVVLYQEALIIYQREADTPNIGRLLHNLALAAQENGDYARAIALNEDALVHWRALGDRLLAGYSLYNQAVCLRLAGDRRRAITQFDTLLSLFEDLGDTGGSAGVHNELGRIACEQGEFAAAVAHLHASTRGYDHLGDRASLIDVLENWALAIALQGNPAYAAQLLGAIEAAQIAIGHPLPPGGRAVFESDVSLVRELLGDPGAFAVNWAEGRATTLETVIAGVQALYPEDTAAHLLKAPDAAV
jgi:predicted ATPase/DNA-binding SARP family transcriptional activator